MLNRWIINYTIMNNYMMHNEMIRKKKKRIITGPEWPAASTASITQTRGKCHLPGTVAQSVRWNNDNGPNFATDSLQNLRLVGWQTWVWPGKCRKGSLLVFHSLNIWTGKLNLESEEVKPTPAVYQAGAAAVQTQGAPGFLQTKTYRLSRARIRSAL